MRAIVGVALLLAAAVPAVAQTPVALDRFNQIALEGGGSVTLRHGAEQRVTLVRGDPEMTRFSVERGRLTIDACVRSCSDYELEVEIVLPSFDAVSVEGGGVVRAERGFADPGSLAAAVSGGGLVDVAAVDAGTVAASVQGGGVLRTRARESLSASINGGGSIAYWGDPRIVSSVNGGGSIRRGGTR